MSKRFIYYGSFASAQYFSDLFGMPDAAYSLRKLTPSVTNCVRVRRSSDNAEQDIGFVANVPNSPIDETALLAFVGSGNGFVVRAYNHNTLGTDFEETTASVQPRIVNAGVVEKESGFASIFYAAGNRIQNNSIAGNSSISIFRIQSNSKTVHILLNQRVAVSAGANYGYVAQSGSTSTGIFEGYGSPTLFINGATPSPLTNRNHVYLAFDGRKISSVINASTSVWLGAQIGAYTGTFNYEGHVPEFIVYFSNKSTDRALIETNINTYYNVF
jgi:hypothetical protein